MNFSTSISILQLLVVGDFGHNGQLVQEHVALDVRVESECATALLQLVAGQTVRVLQSSSGDVSTIHLALYQYMGSGELGQNTHLAQQTVAREQKKGQGHVTAQPQIMEEIAAKVITRTLSNVRTTPDVLVSVNNEINKFIDTYYIHFSHWC